MKRIFPPKKIGFWQRFVADPSIANSLIGDPEGAATAIENARWPQGAVCPFCSSADVAPPSQMDLKSKRRYRCRECARQFNFRHGTFLAGSRARPDRILLAVTAVHTDGPSIAIQLLVQGTKATQESAERLVGLISSEFGIQHRRKFSWRAKAQKTVGVGVGAATLIAGGLWYSHSKPSHARELMKIGPPDAARLVEKIPYDIGLEGAETVLITPKADFDSDAEWVATHAARVEEITNELDDDDS